jgi:hypothetical protein
MSTADLTHRDRAILRAVAAGRCRITGGPCTALTIDGLSCSDQFAGPRLARAGLIVAGAQSEPARLTDTGRALLEAA